MERGAGVYRDPLLGLQKQSHHLGYEILYCAVGFCESDSRLPGSLVIEILLVAVLAVSIEPGIPDYIYSRMKASFLYLSICETISASDMPVLPRNLELFESSE